MWQWKHGRLVGGPRNEWGGPTHGATPARKPGHPGSYAGDSAAIDDKTAGKRGFCDTIEGNPVAFTSHPKRGPVWFSPDRAFEPNAFGEATNISEGAIEPQIWPEILFQMSAWQHELGVPATVDDIVSLELS